MIRRILALILALTLTTPAMAGITQDPEQIMGMVEEYMAEMKALPDNADATYKAAQASYLDGIGSQLRGLTPEDFNLFMFAIMSRYINNPQERPLLFDFFTATRAWIATDLANTALLDNGPISYINPANWSWYTWVAIGAGMVVTRGALKGPLRNTRFVQTMNQMQMKATALKQAGWKGAGWKSLAGRGGLMVTHPMTLATATGAGLGLVEYGLELTKNHRMDPLLVLNVVQTQIACALTYRGLDLADQVDAVVQDEDKMRTQFADIKKDIEASKKEIEVLTKQFARLDNIRSEDPQLQKAMAKIPQNLPEKYSNLQDFRKSLITEGASIDGRCRQVSLTALTIELDKRQTDLQNYHDAFFPPQEPAPDTEPPTQVGRPQ